MTLTKFAGALLMALPLIVVFVFAFRVHGLKGTLAIFGIAFVTLGILVLGSQLFWRVE